MRLLNGKCTSKARLDGKTAVITGCNTGIGKETVRDFYKRGARVVMACRTVDKAKETADDIINAKYLPEDKLGEISIVQLDLGSFNSIRKCAQELIDKEERIDLLINNAGVMMCPESRTEDGFEMQFGTNHLGHFLFTLLLLPKICASRPARIVTVSSVAHYWGRMNFDDLNWEKRTYSSTGAYEQSKLANILFTKELAKRIEAANITGLTVYSLHPGAVKTDLGRHIDNTTFGCFWNRIASKFIKNAVEGAQTSIYCAVDEKTASENGLYYEDCEAVNPGRRARIPEDAEKLWNISLNLAGLGDNYDPFRNLN